MTTCPGCLPIATYGTPAPHDDTCTRTEAVVWHTSWAREAAKLALHLAEEVLGEAERRADKDVRELHNQLYPVIAQRDAQLAAAEQTVREQREVVEAAVDAVLERSDDPGALRKAVLRYLRDRAATVAPDTEGEG